MSTLIVARRNRKLAAFRDAVEALLGKDIVDIIERLVAVMTVRVQSEPLLEDHSLAVSAPITERGSIHIGLFRTTGGPRPRYIWSGNLPEGAWPHVQYTTGHGFVISIRGIGGASVLVCARGPAFVDGSMSICFRGTVRASQRVGVFDGFFLVLDRVWG